MGLLYVARLHQMLQEFQRCSISRMVLTFFKIFDELRQQLKKLLFLRRQIFALVHQLFNDFSSQLPKLGDGAELMGNPRNRSSVWPAQPLFFFSPFQTVT